MSADLRTPPPDAWRDLLSALLDGELPPDEQVRIRDLVAASPEAQEELAALAQVRTWVRDLPAVEPPFGFYERMVRPTRPRRHVGAKVATALAAAAAATVLVVGITPAADSVAPPVAAFANRHLAMDPPDGPPTVQPAPDDVGADLAFEPVLDGDLDAMGAPVMLTGRYQRMSGYKNDDGTMHLVYSNGAAMVSVYEQVGVVAWDKLPDGDMMQVEGTKAWTMIGGASDVLVFERGPVVYTVVAQVSSGAHDDMVDMVDELPMGPEPSMVDRFRSGCRSVVEQFSMGAMAAGSAPTAGS